MEKYIEQYDRMKRWFERFEEINEGRIHDKNSDFYKDEALAFFNSCFHLKDWLKKSNQEMFLDCEELFDKTNGLECMKICADLCNGSKHMVLDNKFRVDKNLRISNQTIKLVLQEKLKINSRNNNKTNSKSTNLNSEEPLIKIKYQIKIKDKRYDAFEVASNCIKEWDEYLKLKKEPSV